MLKIEELPVLLFFFSKICKSEYFVSILTVAIIQTPLKQKSANMKSSAQPSLLFSSNQQSPLKPVESQSPYLKAILSGKLMTARNERDYESANPDREAALRYIKESKLSNKY